MVERTGTSGKVLRRTWGISPFDLFTNVGRLSDGRELIEWENGAWNTTAVNNNGTISNSSQRLSQTLTGSDSYLKVGKGNGAGITIDLGDNPIDSFSVDFQLFKRTKNFSILADGVVINQTSFE